MNYNNNEKKVFNSYGKDSSRSQGSRDFETQDRKPLRYSVDSFTKQLIGKNVTIELVNGKILSGKLLQLGMYDVLIEVKSVENFIVSGQTLTKDVTRNLIVLKSAISTAEVLTK